MTGTSSRLADRKINMAPLNISSTLICVSVLQLWIILSSDLSECAPTPAVDIEAMPLFRHIFTHEYEVKECPSVWDTEMRARICSPMANLKTCAQLYHRFGDLELKVGCVKFEPKYLEAKVLQRDPPARFIMVGYDKNEKKLKEWQYMFAGGASGALTRCTSQPLDVVKIRFQLQVEPIAQGSKYTSLIQATRTILKEEGLIALWSGHIPAQYLSISYGIAQFWCYELLTEKCHKVEPNIPQTFKPMINFTCGAVAGSFATTVSFPFDTIRTRLIAEEKNARVYKGIWHMCQHMVVNEGKLSLFKGLFPTIAQIAPHAGAQFMFYKLVSEYLKPPENLKSNDSSKKPIALSVSLYSGSIAGVLSKLLIYPFDLAKKRMQIQGFQHNRLNFGKQFVCTGFFHCISHTIKCEGFTALYKGLYPSLLKAMLVSALHFTFFEQICNAFRSFDEEL